MTDTLQQIKETITLINSGDALTADKLRAARLEQEHRLEWYAYMLERIEALEDELNTSYNELEKRMKDYNRLDEEAAKDVDRIKELESENTAMRDRIEAIEGYGYKWKEKAHKARKERDELKSENAAMREALERENSESSDAVDMLMRNVQENNYWIRKLNSENAAMKEALEWYADSKNNDWDVDGFDEVIPSPVMIDGGQRARAALASLSQGTESMEGDE